METLQLSSVLDWTKARKKGKELWLFRVPADLDVTCLNGAAIPLGSGEVEIPINGGARMLKISSQEATANEASQVLPLIPNEELGRLSVAKPFSRLVTVSHRLPAAARYEIKEEVPPQQPPKLEGKLIPSGSGPRFAGSRRQHANLSAASPEKGSGSGKKESKKKKSKEKATAEEDALQEAEEAATKEAAAEKEGKKKRKKSKEAESQVAEEESKSTERESEETATQGKSKKTKKKKEAEEEKAAEEEKEEAAEAEKGKKAKRKSTADKEEGNAEDGERKKKKKKKEQTKAD